MSRPSQARARRGIKQEAAQLVTTRRGPGRPPKPPAPAAAPTPAAGPAVAAPVAVAPPDSQGRQFGLTVRALVAPVYKAVLGAELPPAAWEEWGVAAGRFAAYYFPNAAAHPGAQLVGATAVLVLPVALAWPAFAAKQAAARKAAVDAAKGAPAAGAPPATDNDGAGPPGPRPPAPPAGRHSIGGGWSGAARDN